MLHRYDNPENGNNYELSVGEQLIFEIPESPTTGFSWKVESHVPGLFYSDNVEYTKLGNSKDDVLCAGGVTRVLRFNARSAGSGTLTIANKRTWAKDSVDTRKFTIVVKKKTT